MSIRTIFTISIVVTLAACSSIKSVEKPKAKTDAVDGLTYFMPKKDFLVTITVKDSKVSKIVLGTTSAYPDLDKQYVLRHGANVFGKNTLDVGVSESGLLTSAKSTTVSNVTDAFKNLATTIGQLETFGFKMADIPQLPCADGEHSFIYAQPGSYTACGMNINVDRQGDVANVNPHSKEATEEYSGLYYRQNIPYLITATGNGPNAASVVFSPSESKTHFLPVSKTFFSNNEADFAFIDGIPTKYKQETEGEVAALFKLPADIIGAYFLGIGSVFDNFKSTDQKEAAALTESLKLELAKKKYDTCISAIKSGDDELIKELSCQ